MVIMKCASFGAHYFEIAALLRNLILINGMLTNCEVWYGLTQSEISQLEEVDRLFLRQAFNVASTCPVEALYLELRVYSSRNSDKIKKGQLYTSPGD